jgi:hypothetical protein
LHPRLAGRWNNLRCEEDHREADPARYHADRRVRADKHERQEFIASAEQKRVAQRAVGNERDGDGDVEEAEAVEKEVARIRRSVNGNTR